MIFREIRWKLIGLSDTDKRMALLYESITGKTETHLLVYCATKKASRRELRVGPYTSLNEPKVCYSAPRGLPALPNMARWGGRG